MTAVLGIMAGIIFVVYSLYFFKIIKGEPQAFELELLKSLAEWMVERGRASKGQMWLMYFFSVFLEVIYFILSFYLLTNPALQLITAAFAGLECYHMVMMAFSFGRFFGGKTMISQLFLWPLERLSATLFFTHSLLILITLIFF